VPVAPLLPVSLGPTAAESVAVAVSVVPDTAVLVVPVPALPVVSPVAEPGVSATGCPSMLAPPLVP
jgi:hypothetical protein